MALQLLNLPFTPHETLAKELDVRAVLRAAYRLIKAMTVGCSRMQAELAPSLPLFVGHAEAHLVSHDISPTGCVNAIVKDNRTVCAQIEDSSVRQFVKMAALEHAPRFLRFLKNLMCPCGQPIKRNQKFVLDALAEKEAALVLFNDEAGRRKRADLIAKGDHIVNPRGILMYHVELIGLLGISVVGTYAAAEIAVRELLPLDDLVEHLLSENLPTMLKANYMLVFCEAYLVTQRVCRDLQECDELPLLIEMLANEVGSFVDDVLPTAAFEDEDEIELARYIIGVVVPTLTAYFSKHYAAEVLGEHDPKEALAPQLVELLECAESQPDFLQPEAVAKLLEAMKADGAAKTAEDAQAAGISRALQLASDEQTKTEPHPQEHVHTFIEEYAPAGPEPAASPLRHARRRAAALPRPARGIRRGRPRTHRAPAGSTRRSRARPSSTGWSRSFRTA
jgi:hypothetical protein